MILALAESHIPLSMRTLGSLLVARLKRERMESYQSQLTYLLVKRSFPDVAPPHEYAEKIMKTQPKPKSAKQIIGGVLKKLGG